eukprot:3426649-Pleurochrysis_carterae.AAC.1
MTTTLQVPNSSNFSFLSPSPPLAIYPVYPLHRSVRLVRYPHSSLVITATIELQPVPCPNLQVLLAPSPFPCHLRPSFGSVYSSSSSSALAILSSSRSVFFLLVCPSSAAP